MITKEEVYKIRKDCKRIIDYKCSMQKKEREFFSFMYNYNKDIEFESEGWYKLGEAFYFAWNISDRYFRNADAADILDVKDSIIEAINQLRMKRRDTTLPLVYKAYSDAINIVKDALCKLPKRMIRL